MVGWMMLGALLLVVMLVWELVRSYLLLNERYAAPKGKA
jgi:hypothetical protein